jgi:ElaB/YqjD/DUF883 family membrane-anchored ribosome-binding protein
MATTTTETSTEKTTTEVVTEEAKSFLAQAQEAISDAVDATVGAVKEHPIAAAGIAAGVAAAVGGAAYAATQLRSDKDAPASKTKK